MPIYRGTGGSTPLNDNVTEDEVGLLLSRFDTLASELERQTGVVATDLAQAVTAANQAVTDATQQKLFAQAAAQEASGYAVDAFESKQTAQQQAATATTQATQAIEAKDEAVVSAEAARLSELAADQAREEAVQSSAVAQSQATTATLKAQEALESAQSASDSAQSASDSAQSALTSRTIASGQANNAVNAANAAEQSETNAAQSASEAAASAASVDAANLARIDQSNTFAGSQTISKDSGDVGLIIEADTDNDTESDNAFIELRQDGSGTKAGFELDSTNSTVLSSFKQGGTSPFNPIILRQDNSDTQNKSLVLDAFGRLGLNTSNPTASLTIRGDLQASVDPESEMSVERLASFMARSTTGRTQAQLSIVSPESNVVAITSGENDTLKLGTNNPNDDSAFNEVMLLTTQGDVGIGTENPTSKLHVGGDLTVDGNIINAGLLTEETGTWTPVFVANDRVEIGSGTIQRDGEYVKIGNQVTVYFRYTATSPTAASRAIDRLIGLPFPIKNSVDNLATGSTHTINVQFTEGSPSLLVVNNSSDAFFRYNRNNTSDAKPAAPSNGASFAIRGSLTYQTI